MRNTRGGRISGKVTELSKKRRCWRKRPQRGPSASFAVMAAMHACLGAAASSFLTSPSLSAKSNFVARLGRISHQSGVAVLRQGLGKRSSVSRVVAKVGAGRVEMAGGLGKLKREQLQVYEDVEVLSVSLAAHVADVASAAIAARGAFSVVLSGGSLIKTLG